jgi:type II secretory pathway pseudopilin PulG
MVRGIFTRNAGARGFLILEVLVATSVVVVAVTALAQLIAVAVAANARARAVTLAVVLAQQKMEALVATFAEQDAHGAISSVSPAGALDRNIAGYCDDVDQNGATYLRRWSIEALPAFPDSAFVVQVLATRSRGPGDATSSLARRPDTARLITVRTRRSY